MTFVKKYDAVTWGLALLLAAAVVLMPEIGLATSPFSNLCTAAKWLESEPAQAIAMIGIFAVGMGALLGRISWGVAILVCVGIVVIFGATTIIPLLSTGTSCT